jgi:hypothetical protein
VLRALLQQRILRLLEDRFRLARAVVEHLDGDNRELVRASLSARRSLGALAHPIEDPSAYETGPPEPAAALLRYYKQAQRRFGVAWQVLAAVNLVESSFGRARAPSHAGAQGPMQFLPSTWAAYGLGGDIEDPRDAILGAANYLRSSGAPGDYAGALYAYNPSELYVRAVQAYVSLMRRRPRDFFVYYCWQLYVTTPRGDVRVTGPASAGRR